ncbi:MAG TPA: helix-turn-helix transcriptional regulator [Ktedonobacteraceae bacterium]|nr:helix-turn-helix transcriptional regulator [Ktedonobacteraceae bacterium]
MRGKRGAAVVVCLNKAYGASNMVRIKVKEIAKSKGISQSKLSRLADVNVSTLQRIYRNPTDTNINIFTLEKIAKALGVDVSELIESTSQ